MSEFTLSTNRINNDFHSFLIVAMSNLTPLQLFIPLTLVLPLYSPLYPQISGIPNGLDVRF